MVDSANRPISLVRCPQGRAKNCFFQKHDAGSFGPAVKHVPVKEKKGGTEDYLYIDDATGLLTLVQMGTIEVHGWGSRVKPLEKPDRLVFDLDPDVGLDFGDVRSAAVRLKALLADLGLVSFPMTTGGKGLHVVVPLDATVAVAQGHRFRRALRPRHRPGRAGAVHRQHPQGARGKAASSSTGCATSAAPPRSCPIRPAPGTAPRSPRPSPGRSWTASRAAMPSPFWMRINCSTAPVPSSLAGWGQAKQKLPKA